MSFINKRDTKKERDTVFIKYILDSSYLLYTFYR